MVLTGVLKVGRLLPSTRGDVEVIFRTLDIAGGERMRGLIWLNFKY
jgi:hypothetical protein